MPPKKATTALNKTRMVAPKVKPLGMADKDCAKEMALRTVVTMDQNKRHAIQR
jgi:hypothetical protein